MISRNESQHQHNKNLAQIQALTAEIEKQGDFMKKLQQAKSEIAILQVDKVQMECSLKKEQSIAHNRKERLQVAREEIKNLHEICETLKRQTGKVSTGCGTKVHKQTRTRTRCEKIDAVGRICWARSEVYDKIRERKAKQTTRLYVDPMGEVRRRSAVKLKESLYLAIRRRVN